MSKQKIKQEFPAGNGFAPITGRVGGETRTTEHFKDSNGKDHKATIKQFTEYDVEDKRLIKIAPMFFFSLDSHKVIMVPFTMKFSIDEYVKQVGAMSVNFQKLLEEISEQEAGDKK